MVIVRPWKLLAKTRISAWPSGHALDLEGPLAGGLDGGLDRLGAGVHREELVEAGELAELLVEGAELVVAEGAGGQGHGAGLLEHAPAGSRGWQWPWLTAE